MVGLVALDLILRILRRGAVGMALIIEVARVDFADRPADSAGFRVPADVIADFEILGHKGGTAGRGGGSGQPRLTSHSASGSHNCARARPPTIIPTWPAPSRRASANRAALAAGTMRSLVETKSTAGQASAAGSTARPATTHSPRPGASRAIKSNNCAPAA